MYGTLEKASEEAFKENNGELCGPDQSLQVINEEEYCVTVLCWSTDSCLVNVSLNAALSLMAGF